MPGTLGKTEIGKLKSEMAFLELIDLTKHFKVRKGFFRPELEWVKAVEGVSLELERGETLGLVGESGCGKTTLSRMIMQLLRPTRGTVVLEGEALAELTPAQMRARRIDFQMIFQDPYASLNPRMTVDTMLSEAVRRRHPDLRREALLKRVGDLLERVGLSSRSLRKYPHEFSGGQRQRIAIARALAPEPRLVLADEPVSALDVSIQSQILNLLRELNRELKLTTIFISHDLAVVHYMASQIAVMRGGELVELGEASQVFHHPRHAYTRRLIESVPKIRGQEKTSPT